MAISARRSPARPAGWPRPVAMGRHDGLHQLRARRLGTSAALQLSRRGGRHHLAPAASRDRLGPEGKIMKLGIIGVGSVGSAIAMAAASRARVREIVLV